MSADPVSIGSQLGIAGFSIAVLAKLYLEHMKSTEKREERFSGAIEKLSENVGENTGAIRELRDYIRKNGLRG